ncbi:uncharacterized protein LOC114297944 [Camellia sinensis]|uniref:uncharacterized protein LOC114297944 n=1 Tax=Camellia sinensis TaxID=4442 RepID=UPI001036CF2A|nr:uncharacterized protein LOC114297944 [Camellia sinensis]
MEENNIVDDCGWKPKVGMPFDSEQAAYDFYNTYGGKVGFSIRKAYANKHRQTKEITSRTFVCYKEGSRGIDKRDPLVKNPRQEGGADYTPQCESQPHFRMVNNSIQSGGTVYTSQGESQPHFVMGGNSIQSGDAIYTCQGQSQSCFVMGGNSTQDHGLRVNFSQSQPRFVMGINYNKDHRHDMYISPSQLRPQVLMGGTSGPPLTYGTYDGNNTAQSMPFVYPTHRSFQGLLRGTSVENFAVHLSQTSHSPADNHVD